MIQKILGRYDVAEITQALDLPDLPESPDVWDTDCKILILFRQGDENVVLTNPVTFDDANEYTNREDTHGDDWFVGRDAPNDYEPGEVY
jgi:hypothetical protein